MWWKRLLQKIVGSEPLPEVVSPSQEISAPNRSDAHIFARSYWQNCSNTFLASDPTYYDRQEKELRGFLHSRVGRVRNALDIGCGNGRFSLTLAEFSDCVIAFDLSPTLIAEAIATAERRDAEGIQFQVLDLEVGIPAGPFDLVACMGVISTLIDDVAYNALLEDLARSAAPNGFVITKDTLSTAADGRLVITDTYVTNYRNLETYERDLEKQGLRIVQQSRLATLEGMVNNLYLWQKD
jgi:2-polyprenyl-3-methyl-5-hydroxy-6-metoxy-1,4-benzoquinol methylase